MSRTLGGGLTAHVAGTAHTLCRMLLFVLRDGTSLGITDHNNDIDFDLPEEPGLVTYSSRSGFRISDVQINPNLDAGSYDVQGPIADVVTLPQLLGGRWRFATTYLFEVDWKNPTSAADLMKGQVTKTGPSGGEFKFTVQDERHKLTQVVGRTITNQCPRNFPDCCVNIAPETNTTIESVTDLLTLTVVDTITAADFVGGRITFTSGPLMNIDPIEIYAVSGRTLTLFESMPDDPTIGDSVTLKEGCDGTIQMCANRFNNGINHRGFAAVPGNKTLQPAIPGQGN